MLRDLLNPHAGAEEVKDVASILEKTRLVGVQIREDTMEKRKFHCLKHSIATHLLDAGADLAFVKNWLGHADIQNMTIYARLTTTMLGAQERTIFASHRVVCCIFQEWRYKSLSHKCHFCAILCSLNRGGQYGRTI